MRTFLHPAITAEITRMNHGAQIGVQRSVGVIRGARLAFQDHKNIVPGWLNHPIGAGHDPRFGAGMHKSLELGLEAELPDPLTTRLKTLDAVHLNRC